MRRLALLLVCGSALVGLLGPVEAEAATTGVVEGTVTPLAWAQEVEVCVVERQPSEICVAPGADGSYVLHEVPFGGVQIEFVPSFRSRLLRQYYDGVSKLSEARTIVLTPTSPTVERIDAGLIEGGAIEGTVTAAAGGSPLSEVEVCAVSVESVTVKSCGETDTTGYELHSLPSGTYRVGFWGIGTSAVYEPWSHQPVGVAAGNTTVGVNATLALGAQIRGRVTIGSGGEHLAGSPVCLFLATASKPQRCTYSDEAGEYSFVGLSGGTYQVGFSLLATEIGGESLEGEDDGFESQYYAGAADRATATAISVLAPMIVEGVDAALVATTARPPAVPVAVANPIVPAALTVAEPPKKTTSCKRGYWKKKVKGNVRCMKPAKQKAKKQRSKKHHRQKRKKVSRPRTAHR
jgi:hypothetical protein